MSTTTTITNVRVFDGAGLTSSTSVTFADGVITGIGGPATGTTFDGAGRVLLPGLIDSHVHVTSADDLVALASHGVTTALDMASPSVHALMTLVREVGGVDVRSAGPPASAVGGIHTLAMGFPSESALPNPSAAASFVRRRIYEGASYIKLIVDEPVDGGLPALDEPTIAAVVDAAHATGLLTIAHVTSANAAQRAADCGVDILTHVPLGDPIGSDLAGRVAGHVVSVPTLTMMNAVSKLGSQSPAYRPGMDFGNATGSVRALHAAQVPLLAGTDANTAPMTVARVEPGQSLHEELAFLVDAGLSPIDALRAATSLPAEVFGLVDRGAIEVGKRADLVLVDGDPSTDIRSSRSVEAVWIAGELQTNGGTASR